MGLELLLSVILVASYHLQCGDGQKSLSIKDFISNAKNTSSDHSQAFQDAWKALCKANGRDKATSLVIHAKESYIIQPQLFLGPCLSPFLNIQIDGKLEAPKSVKEWKNTKSICWLCFVNVKGLVLNGSGFFHSHGEAWWSSVDHSYRPRTVTFDGSHNIIYNGITQMNSAKNHISVSNSTNITLSNLHLIAPEVSPNTDGIDITHSNKIQILNSYIQTGDDCVAINGGSYDINITNVACGPGHGISIGSLGRGGINETVENVKVRNCSFNGTQNGARIKTWDGGRGFVKNILYKNITLINVKYPIIIDQHYCNGAHNCKQNQASAVKVSNVTFQDFKGTCISDIAIKLDCNDEESCRNIVMEHINITSPLKRSLTSYCKHTHVASHFVSIDINCGLFDEELSAPAQPPRLSQPPATTNPPNLFR